MTRVRKLHPWQASVVRKARALRDRYSVNALAQRFGVSESTISRYAQRTHKDPRPRR